jgi:hypothetical protein
MSLVKANTYQDASGGSNAVFSGVASPPNSMGFRNRIINGNMVIDQRNAGASVTPTAGAYTLDRWYADMSAASKYSIQRNAGSVTPPAGYTNYLGVTSLAATSLAAGDYYYLFQGIEGLNISDLGWGAAGAQTVTLSFWVRSSLTGTFGGSLKNSANNRSYPFTYTISAANTWEQKSVTIAGDTSGTWLTTNGLGIGVHFGLGVGSTFSGTAGAWAGSNFLSATGATSVVGTNGATFYITGVQLEAGTNASAFERIDYGRQLIQCQRYLPAFNSTGNTFRLPASGVASAGSTVFFTITFPVTTRVPATGMVVSSAAHFAAGVDGLIGATTASAFVFNALSSNNAARAQMTTSTAPFSSNQNVQLDAVSASGILYFTGCEL